ncbi:DUF590-domain-containing protein [Cylindrobasidium torrendii FP15055 ss-10]|uniref:DUF590-domain-containing protein n=1 Tax=Cylindrobasidium torrendii FP15055 ss-10 TaxID=1314674 RepID=A0A0D7B1E4_9AGAR|nr:DUF590-domain-containing protein [Cylindrobasidium torrendii FP15055 ss-10]
MSGPTDVDVVITFKASPKVTLSKQQIKEDAAKAEQQYNRLLSTLNYAGLRAVARRGESLGHLLIFVHCPDNLLKNLARRERHYDFLNGLPTAAPVKSEDEIPPLPPSDRIRLVHTHISAMPADGGLGIHPGSPEWDLVESIMALHDKEFNDRWLHAWTHSKLASVSDATVRDQFGESVALYFAFLKAYTHSLIFPAALGTFYFFFGTPYSPVYSCLLVLWATCFVEWWRVRERIISLGFGSQGSFRVEKRRTEYNPNFSWWQREIRVLGSIPVVLAFVGALVVVLTSTFVFEAFVTRLYTGPGHQYIGLSPTILLALFVPRILAIYQTIAKRLTGWENHAHHSSHVNSLTLKTFVLNSLVGYLPLALSAFLYVPFGEGIMGIVQSWFSDPSEIQVDGKGIWDMDATMVRHKLDPGRLKTQMFAYTVTQQVSNTFMEIGLPYVLRAVDNYRKKKDSPKKKVVFEDEKEKGGQAERQFLEDVRHQASLPEYELFLDYSEMAMQFGYVAVWSTIWPIAPLMAYINNVFELRSDAFKIITHQRRPISVRTDTIGPWLEALTFLTWLAAVINTSLVYLFCPRSQDHCSKPSSIDRVHARLFAVAGTGDIGEDSLSDTVELLKMAALIAFAASHGYLLLRAGIRHLMERAVYKESKVVKDMEREGRSVKESFLKSVSGSPTKEVHGVQEVNTEAFWAHDEGLEEIQRISKEA